MSDSPLGLWLLLLVKHSCVYLHQLRSLGAANVAAARNAQLLSLARCLIGHGWLLELYCTVTLHVCILNTAVTVVALSHGPAITFQWPCIDAAWHFFC
jgi:hypothetical protein